MPKLPFYTWEELPWIEMNEQMRRKQIWSGKIMNIRMELIPGAKAPEHTHINEQAGNVIKGSLRMKIGDEEMLLNPGCGYIIPPNVPHSLEVVGEETAIMLETFTPPREDLM